MGWLRDERVDISKYLPEFMRGDPALGQVLAIESKEHERQRLEIRDLLAQAFIDTATWGLGDWERILALKPAPNDSYAQRRNQILLYLQGRQISTINFLERLVKRYLSSDGTNHIVEHNEQNVFHVFIDSGKVLYLNDLHDGLDTYKPAHLAYSIILAMKRRFFLNRSGAIQLRTTPEHTWTAQEPYIVFDTGLNAAGATETVKHTDTVTQQHSAYIFSGSTLNGRVHLNGGGKYSLGEYDAGQDVTESWKVFRIEKPPTLNGVARLNATPTETRRRTYHVADWRTRVTQRADTLNQASGSWKCWTTSRSTTTQERRYKSPAPYYATNRIGSTTVTREDVGYEQTLTETLFCASRLNGAGAQHDTQTTTQAATSTYLTFTTPGRLNGRSRPQLNASATQEHTVSRTITKSTTRAYFAGTLLCGHLDLNDCRSTVVTHAVHIPAWRDVVHRHGACVLNAVKHETRYKTITHTAPAKTEKYFSPNRGTLLNGRAVLGDMVL
nr:putative phage tail protein [Mitsuokella multacida]